MREHNCPSKKDLIQGIKKNVKEFGHQVTMVEGDSYFPSFAYSVGLTETYNHPEIICFGLPSKLGQIIINDVVNLIKEKGPIVSGVDNLDVFKESKAVFLEVNCKNLDDYFGSAIIYYESKDFKALELIWTDRNNKYPWEDNFEKKFKFKQPLLDRNLKFKFLEENNLSVFTTRQWLHDGKDILKVVHDEEGDWHFLTGDQMSDDIRLVSLDCMVERDLTLNDVFDLNYGQSAERKFKGGKWVVE